ncbi:MAG: DUF2480 family protein [Flavobacteriaceae bacterium]|nr:DUF2480 family protein [Flavobacteriaceae bacterium]
MSEKIINRVAQSHLVTIDLEEFYPEGERILLDISKWLHEGLLLREKDFRTHVENHDWPQYKGKYVALSCSTDAIIPSWAFLLITTYLAKYAKKTVVGDLELLETVIFQEIIENFDTSSFHDKPVIIKGCVHKPIPPTASVQLIDKLLPMAKSIMFGEACSTVPLYKRKK